MPPAPVDLLIRAGRVVCPANGWDGPGAVAVCGDRIVAAGPAVPGGAGQILDFPQGLVLPGLIDLHAHPAREGSLFGIDPDVDMLPQGVTTVLSQGDAGAVNWPRYWQTTITACRTRVRLAINLAALGETTPDGCFAKPDAIDGEACSAAIEEDAGRFIWGIAVNTSHHACGGTDPREVLRRALLVAERTGRPLLYGMRRPTDWSFAEQLSQLRPGDVVTYCYRREPHCIVAAGHVHPAIRAARERGVRFDVGHGMASFDFATAETALADGFPPDTISSDQRIRHRGAQPPHTLARTLSKLLAAGMQPEEAFAAVTIRPARILGLEHEIGTLSPGACADLTVLAWKENGEPLLDAHGCRRTGGCWETVLTVRSGQLVPNGAATVRERG